MTQITKIDFSVSIEIMNISNTFKMMIFGIQIISSLSFFIDILSLSDLFESQKNDSDENIGALKRILRAFYV